MKNGAVIYCRVSTEEQSENNSLPYQLKVCREAAKRLGCRILHEFKEDESGAKQDRTEMMKMLKFCTQNRRKIQYVIVKDIDRFSRDTYIHLFWRQQFRTIGIELYSVNQPSIADGTAEAQLSESIFSAFAQFERSKILERTSAGSKEVILRGGWTAPPPYGYKPHRRADNLPTLLPVPEEAKAVVKAFEYYAEGMNLLQIATKLHALGFLPRRGKKLSSQSIHNWLTNPVYVGKILSKHFPDQQIAAVHEPIVAVTLWNKAQRRLVGKGPATRQKFNPTFPLTTIVRCYKCNTPLTGSLSRGKSGKQYAYYHCRKPKCLAKNLQKKETEDRFLHMIRHVQFTKEAMKLVEDTIIRVWREKWLRQGEENRRLDRHMIKLKEKREQIEDKYICNQIDEEAYERHLQKVKTEIAHVDEARDKLMISEDRMLGLLKFTREFLTSISNTWENAVPARKRLIQKIVFPVGLRLKGPGTFGTLELPPMLELSTIAVTQPSKLAAPRGIEPRFAG